jgi:hypothetical protein
MVTVARSRAASADDPSMCRWGRARTRSWITSPHDQQEWRPRNRDRHFDHAWVIYCLVLSDGMLMSVLSWPMLVLSLQPPALLLSVVVLVVDCDVVSLG